MKNRQKKIESSLKFFQKHSNCDLDYCVEIDSNIDGKTVLISCATHGNEQAGVDFAIEFIKNYKSGKLRLKRGKIFLLLNNYKAFSEDKRYIDYDLNRAFTDNKELNLWEYKRAYEIESFFKNKKIDYFVDIHSVSIGDFKMIIFNQDDISNPLFKILINRSKMDIIFLYREQDIPGIMIDFFKKSQNTFGMAIECGNHFNENAKELAKDEVFNLLESLDMIDVKIKPTTHKKVVYKTIDIVKSGRNFKWLIEDYKTGIKLKKGDIISIDETNGIQTAQMDCILVMPSKKVKSSDKEAGFLCEESYI